MSTLKFDIPGKPYPQPRPRFTKTGKPYKTDKHVAAERNVAWTAKAAMGGGEPHDGPVFLAARFVFEPPPSWTKAKKAQALDGALPHIVRPDVDNLVKLLLDGVKGILWRDDTQVYAIMAGKEYGPQAHTAVAVTFDGAT